MGDEGEFVHLPPPPQMAPVSQCKAGRVAVVLGLLLLLGIAAVPATIGWSTHRMWSNLRDDARTIETPDGWTRLGVIEEGSAGCFISCDSPRVTVVFRTAETAKKACATLREKADLLANTVDQGGFGSAAGGSCPWEAKLAKVRLFDGRPRMFAYVDSAKTWQGPPGLGQSDRLPPKTPGNVVSIVFSSGLD